MVDLYFYARDNVPNYKTITTLPQENLDYLNSGLIVTSAYSAFNSCEKLQSFPKLNIDFSQCENTREMFAYCKSLTSLDLTWLNISKCTATSAMFKDCTSLISLNISNWDTSNVSDMAGMFRFCPNLTHIEGIIDMRSCDNRVGSVVPGYANMFEGSSKISGVKIRNPHQDYYNKRSYFENMIRLTSNQYTIVS